MVTREERITSAEDEVKTNSEDISKIKMQFDREMQLLKVDFEGRVRKLKQELCVLQHTAKYSKKELSWKETMLTTMRSMGGRFIEGGSLASERNERIDDCARLVAAAVTALEEVTPTDMKVLRRYVHPPPLVWSTLHAILKVNGEWNTTWEEAQVLLTDNYFFHFFVPRAKRFNAEALSDEILNDIEVHLLDPEFEPEVVAQVSTPCAAFCKFVRAVYDAARTARIVKISGFMQEDVENQVGELKMKIADVELKVKRIEAQIGGLSDDVTQRKQQLKDKYDERLQDKVGRFMDSYLHYNSLITDTY